jgi:hypothetical protein
LDRLAVHPACVPPEPRRVDPVLDGSPGGMSNSWREG